MNILVITGYLYPHIDANSEIGYRLADVLKREYHANVSVMGWDPVLKDSYVKENPYGLTTIPLQTIIDYHRIHHSSKSRSEKLFRSCITPRALFLLYSLQKRDYGEAFADEYAFCLRRIIKRNHFDCIIGISEPFHVLQAIMRAKLSVPFIAYKLDPFPTEKQCELERKITKQCRKDERTVSTAANGIFVPTTLYQELLPETPKELQHRIHCAEFPNVIRQVIVSGMAPVFPIAKIHCVFTGRLYKDIRNPRYTISLFEKLEKYGIVFHIVGAKEGAYGIPEKVPPNVICYGRIPSDEAMRYMQAADILVNIGNTIMNQIPSKILSYISTGKPILNIIKSAQCPTLSYMEQYPLALNLVESPEIRQEDVERVRDFILASKGKQIPFEDIQKQYYTCTPEYVGKQLYDVICEVVQEAKERE